MCDIDKCIVTERGAKESAHKTASDVTWHKDAHVCVHQDLSRNHFHIDWSLLTCLAHHRTLYHQCARGAYQWRSSAHLHVKVYLSQGRKVGGRQRSEFVVLLIF